MKLFERFFSSEKQEKKTNARQAPALAALSLALMGCASNNKAQMEHYERQINRYTQQLNELKAAEKKRGEIEDSREADLKSLLANFDQLPGLQANIELKDNIQDITGHEFLKILTGNEEDDNDSEDNVIRSDGETFGRAEFIAKARFTLKDEGAPDLISSVDKATVIRLQEEVRQILNQRSWSLDERGLIAGDTKLPFQGGLAEVDVTLYQGNVMLTLTNHDGSVHTAIIPDDFGTRKERYQTSELDTDSYTLER